MLKIADRWQTLDLVEAFQLAQAVSTLHDLGLLDTLKKPASAEELASRYQLDPDLLRGTLEFVAARTNLMRKSGKQFVVSRNYAAESRFLLDLYVGAYGGNAIKLRKLLSDPTSASDLVDRKRYARAFATADETALGVLPELIRELNFDQTLDMGSGTGGLLLTLARQSPSFVGWGVDTNRAALQVARRKVALARLEGRLGMFEGDCRQLKTTLPESVRANINSLVACNVANEMFHKGHHQSLKWLKQLRTLFPGRPFLILDYYSRLGKKLRQGSVERKTLLHDYAQLISGQGIPPADAKEWRALYRQSGARLVHIIEDSATTRFIHILQL